MTIRDTLILFIGKALFRKGIDAYRILNYFHPFPDEERLLSHLILNLIFRTELIHLNYPDIGIKYAIDDIPGFMRHKKSS